METGQKTIDSVNDNGHWWERRKGERRRDADRSEHERLRHYQLLGSMVGNVSFIFGGIALAFYYGGFGGMQFFAHMWLLDQLGNFAALFGVAAGIFIALICVWTLNVIFWSALGTLLYYSKHHSFPLGEQ